MMKKNSSNPKRKHHFVWAHYMRKWSYNKNEVFYTTQKDKHIIRTVGVGGISYDKGFYDIPFITDLHHKCILDLCISPSTNKNLKSLHTDFLNKILYVQRISEYLIKNNNELSIEISNLQKSIQYELLENMYSDMESESKIIIDELALQNLSILNEENMPCFMYFLACQYTRTNNFKENIFNNFRISNQGKPEVLEVVKILEEVWSIISYFFGINIGSSNFEHRNIRNHSLLINETNTPFITSDQPVINIHSALKDNEVNPPSSDQWDMFYPISPKVAYVISSSNNFDKGKVFISENIVEELNIKIAKKANVHIIGNSETALKPYCKYVGTWKHTILSQKYE